MLVYLRYKHVCIYPIFYVKKVVSTDSFVVSRVPKKKNFGKRAKGSAAHFTASMIVLELKRAENFKI